jgi:TolB protein
METGKTEALTAGLASETRADVSPDGSRIAFTSGGVDTDLIEVPLDNSPIRTLLSTSRNETNPSWSPDGSQFAYVQDSVGRGTEIWLRSVNGAWSRPLIRSTSAAVTFTNPRFSPDGQRILYESWSSEGYLLWITTVGGGNPVRVTPERNHQHAPAWSPDGNWVAYRANVGDERLIEKVPSGGGHPVTLARTVTAFFVVWSPNGEWLCYVDFQSIHLVAADGSRDRKLVDRASNVFGFSGDGRKLYFVAPEGSKSALWSIEIASSKMRLERMLDTSAAAMRGFSLHPDGKRFATSVAVSHEDIWILDGFERPGRLFSLRLF